MNTVMASLLGILLCWNFPPSGIDARDVTKADVKKLLDAKVSEATILTYLEAHGPVAPLSSTDLVELKEAGASAALLKTLVESASSSTNVPSSQQYGTIPYRNYSSNYYYSSPYYPYYYYSHHQDYYPRYQHDFGHGPRYQTHPYLHSFSPQVSPSGHSGHGTQGGGHGGGGHGHH